MLIYVLFIKGGVNHDIVNVLRIIRERKYSFSKLENPHFAFLNFISQIWGVRLSVQSPILDCPLKLLCIGFLKKLAAITQE
ncbi:hypothetical protein BU056_01395 [Staphylococcus succinus]|nr:hypothetical protein BU056_01395 [Staphylococcus succinus]